MSGSDVARLLRQRGYARFFLVVAASRATGTMFNVAGVLLVLERTGSLALAGVSFANWMIVFLFHKEVRQCP